MQEQNRHFAFEVTYSQILSKEEFYRNTRVKRSG
jgi:hypothetical protein